MTTFIESRDYEESLAPSEKPPMHLLHILPTDKMKATLVDTTPITNQQRKAHQELELLQTAINQRKKVDQVLENAS